MYKVFHSYLIFSLATIQDSTPECPQEIKIRNDIKGSKKKIQKVLQNVETRINGLFETPINDLFDIYHYFKNSNIVLS